MLELKLGKNFVYAGFFGDFNRTMLELKPKFRVIGVDVG